MINEKIELFSNTKYEIFKEQKKRLQIEKSKIDKIENKKDWDKIKKITNTYEKIFSSNKYNINISNYIAISRSFFKLWEIIHEFNLIDKNKNIVSANLAEGPGGFIEAIIKYTKNVNVYGITLKPKNVNTPNWNKFRKKFNKKNIKTLFGSLYDVNILKKYKKLVKSADIVTADGGFDYSSNFNTQEEQSYRIIFCEIVSALLVQKKGGSFVCKIFDIFNIFTLKCIYLLFKHYGEIIIYKPKTSRLANSEKYLVCKKYMGIKNDKMISLLNCVKNWTDNINDIKGIKITNKFIKFIYKYNEKYLNKQIKIINLTILYINKKLINKEYNKIIFNQILKAIEWCNKYNIEINKNSYYYKKFID